MVTDSTAASVEGILVLLNVGNLKIYALVLHVEGVRFVVLPWANASWIGYGVRSLKLEPIWLLILLDLVRRLISLLSICVVALLLLALFTFFLFVAIFIKDVRVLLGSDGAVDL